MNSKQTLPPDSSGKTRIFSPKKLVISIESRKGGSGKSIVSLLLGKKLIDEGYQVLVIDADITGTPITRSLESQIYPAPQADPSHPGTYLETGYHIVRTKEIRHTEPRSEDERNEKYYADFFKSFDLYLQSHITPAFCMRRDNSASCENRKEDQIYHVLPGQVNVLGSNFFMNSSPDNSGDPGQLLSPNVLFNDLHSRWLIQFIKRICADFTLCFLTRYSGARPLKIAIIIDNSPGNAGISPMLREWLTDMGPGVGKFLMMTSIDVRDLEPSLDDLDRVHRLYDRKRATAVYYHNPASASSNQRTEKDFKKQFDEVFFRKLHECDHYNANRETQIQAQLTGNDDYYLGNEFLGLLKEQCKLLADKEPDQLDECVKQVRRQAQKNAVRYRSPTELAYDIFLHQIPRKYLCKTLLKTPVARLDYQAVIINNVPADLFAERILNSHDVKTKEIFENLAKKGILKEIVENRELKRPELLDAIREHCIVYHEPLLAYAHLQSNEFKPGKVKRNPDLKWQDYYFQQIYDAKMLCAILQRDFDEVLQYFTNVSYFDRATEKEYDPNTLPDDDFLKLEVLNRTMNRLRSILYPFAHNGLHRIFPSISVKEKRGDDKTTSNVESIELKVIGLNGRSDRVYSMGSIGSHMTPFHMLMQRIAFYRNVDNESWYIPKGNDLIHMQPISRDSMRESAGVRYMMEMFSRFCRLAKKSGAKSEHFPKAMTLLIPWIYHNFFRPDDVKDNDPFIETKNLFSWAKKETLCMNTTGNEALTPEVAKRMYDDVYNRFINLISDTSFIFSALSEGIKGNDIVAGNSISAVTGLEALTKKDAPTDKMEQSSLPETIGFNLRERTSESPEAVFRGTQFDLVGSDIFEKTDTVIEGILRQWKIKKNKTRKGDGDEGG